MLNNFNPGINSFQTYIVVRTGAGLDPGPERRVGAGEGDLSTPPARPLHSPL